MTGRRKLLHGFLLPLQGWPLEILDASKLTGSAEKFQKQLDEGAAVLKTTYWYVAHVTVIVGNGGGVLNNYFNTRYPPFFFG